MKGFLLIDKEKGDSSFDVIRKLRKILGIKKIGHAGTLDPLATGLLLVAIGEGTKLLEYFVEMDKEYEVKGKFGFVSDSFDGGGKISEGKALEVSEDEVRSVIRDKFLGNISQIPPKFSALKVEGVRAYTRARRGEEFEMKPRDVKIYECEILKFNWPFVKFRVKCGSGTYIRSLIHDLGRELGCGAYVEELRRTEVGKFRVENALKIEKELNKKVEQEMLSLEEALADFPHMDLNYEELEGLKDGKVLLSKKIEQGGVAMAFYRGNLLGVLENYPSGGIKYRKMIL